VCLRSESIGCVQFQNYSFDLLDLDQWIYNEIVNIQKYFTDFLNIRTENYND
jgi:hypothetical protein